MNPKSVHVSTREESAFKASRALAVDIYPSVTYTALQNTGLIIENVIFFYSSCLEGLSIAVRKGVAVWVLGSLTFLAGLHALDGFLWLTGYEHESVLLSVYPFTGLLGTLDPVLYFVFSLVAVFLLWGGTTVVALRNPIETFLGKVLEDGKKENQGDLELLEAKTSVLEMMSETLANNSSLLAGLRDVVFNVRSEVLRLQPVNESVEALREDIGKLKKTLKNLEREIKKYKLCPACGREILAEFRLCPYCGENLLKPAVDSGAVMLAALPISHAERKKGRKR